jgi:SAM-dependent methyltransferase
MAGDEWVRRELWSHYERLFKPGDRVLDVGCGTGIDAIFLAQRGVTVVGIDVSSGMIAELRSKVERLGLEGRIAASVGDLDALEDWPARSLDGIVSAFAGLNTSPDLRPFAVNAARALRPNGRLLIHCLNRQGVWEWLALVRRRYWRAAKRLGKQDQRVFWVGGLALVHYAYLPGEMYERFFSDRFRLREAYGLSAIRPPNVRRLPPAVQARLGEVERRVRKRRPFLNWGRFFVLEMEPRAELEA